MRSGEITSDGAAIRIAGKNITLERLNMHDNGQDVIQGISGNRPILDLVIKESWLYNERVHDLNRRDLYSSYMLEHLQRNGKPLGFNEPCAHADAIQIFANGNNRGLTIDSSIIGPNLRQGIISGNDGYFTNVTIHNSLFYGLPNGANIRFQQGNEDGITVTNTTFAGGGAWEQLYIKSKNITFRNSLFVNNRLNLNQTAHIESDNCTASFVATKNGSTISFGTASNLQFADEASGDYRLTGQSACQGIGSTIGSAAQLVNLIQGNAPSPAVSTAPSPTLPVTPAPLSASPGQLTPTNPQEFPSFTPEPQPSGSVGPSPSCPQKSKGDADCNNKVTLTDIEIWRSEFIEPNGSVPFRADFNDDGRVTLVDMQIWQDAFLN
jgi:hypothetical protein